MLYVLPHVWVTSASRALRLHRAHRSRSGIPASLRHKRVRTHPRQQNTNSSCCACRRSALLSSFSSFFFFPSIYLMRQITSEAAALSPQNPADRYAINPNCTKAASNPGRNADKIFESCFILSQREGVKWHAATSRLPQPCKHHPNA